MASAEYPRKDAFLAMPGHELLKLQSADDLLNVARVTGGQIRLEKRKRRPARSNCG